MNIDGLVINDFEEEAVRGAYPGAFMVDTMKVWSLPKNKKGMKSTMCSNGDYFAQLKKDGYWYQAEVTSNDMYLFSRNKSAVTGLLTEKSKNVPHIKGFLKKNLPAGTIVIGEIYIPGKTSKDITKVMGCLPLKAIKRQKEEGNVKYYIHDIIMFGGRSLFGMGAEKRYNFLKKLNEAFNLDSNPDIEIAEAVFENIEEFVFDALARGEEGAVLKKKDFPYQPGKRPAWSTIKFKKETAELDVICMGFEKPKKLYEGTEVKAWQYWVNCEGELCSGLFHGKEGYTAITKSFFNGWIGSVRIGAFSGEELIEIGTVSSGISDILQSKIKDNKELFIGRPLVVGGMELDCEEKTIRHPFIDSLKGINGFRDDIDAEDCTMNKIFQ